MRSGFATAGAALYLFIFTCASVYPLFDHSTFAGLPAVLLGLPWIDYLPSKWLLLSIALNAAAIYLLLAAVASLYSLLRRRRA
jgi:hypothetical protein